MEKNPSSSTSSRTDRKTIERNRRNHMKSLFSNLNSLVPSRMEVGGSSSVSVSLPDQLDEATKYIKKLQVKLEKMKEKKQLLLSTHHQLNYSANSNKLAEADNPCLKVSVHKTGSTIQVSLITSAAAAKALWYHYLQVVRVLQEEGAEVVNANLSVVGDTAFHSFHSLLDGQHHISIDSIQNKILERLVN